MKKILSFFALAALLLTASCSKQESPVLGEDQVIISLGLEGVSATRAISDGSKVNQLVYEVYDKNGALLGTMDQTTEEPVTFPYSLSLPLAKGQDYTILFWAQNSGCQAYNTESLKEVVVDYTDATNNDETRDAFYAAVNVHVTGGPQKVDVVLNRPFAQVNVAVPQAEWKRAIDAGVNVSQSSVVFTQEVAKKIDLSTGNVSEYTSVEYTAKAIPTEKLTVNNEDYVYLSMSYILVGKEKSMVNNATFTFNSNVNAVTLSVPNLPVQRNYRTNVLGTFLVDYVDFNIVVDPIYNEDEHGVINGQVYTEVSTVEDFFGAVEDSNIDLIILNKDIDLNQISTKSTTGDPQVIIKKGRDLTIDLNDHKISATSSQTGKNYNMFDVSGTLTVKNGTMEYEHKGENMGWNNSTNLFNVTAGGILNLEGVTAKNLGGSDMAFVAHLNNWGEVTLNVKDSYLESKYIAVRVFNSGNDMNNVIIYNSTLDGKYCFWVHNYTVADFGTEAKAAAHQALLNFDIFNGTNNFVYTGIAPVLFGFTDEIYFDANGAQYMFSAEELAAALTSDATEINVVLYNDITGDVTVEQKPNVKITIDGNGHNYNGTILVDGKSAGYETAGLTIQNIKFKSENISAGAYINLGRSGDDNTRYTRNVIVKNCTFEGYANKPVAVKSYTGGDRNISIIGCTVESNMHSLAQLANVETGLQIKDCNVYSKNGANINESPALEMSNCIFDVTGYAVRVGVNGTVNSKQKTFAITKSTLKSACAESDDAVIVIRDSATNAELDLTGTTLIGDPKISGNTEETIINR